MRDKKVLEIIDEIKADNPYFESVFREPTHEQYAEFNSYLKDKGLCPSAYNGAVCRKTWNNCCQVFEERIRNKEIDMNTIIGKIQYILFQIKYAIEWNWRRFCAKYL